MKIMENGPVNDENEDTKKKGEGEKWGTQLN
jgi:hypothetical protein